MAAFLPSCQGHVRPLLQAASPAPDLRGKPQDKRLRRLPAGATGLLLGAAANLSLRGRRGGGRVRRGAGAATEGAARELPLPPGKPGNAFLDLLKYVKDPDGYIAEQVKEYGPVFQMNYFGRKTVIVGGADGVTGFTSAEKNITKSALPDTFSQLHTEYGTMNLAGEVHKTSRVGLINSALCDEAFEFFLPVIQARCSEFLDSVESRGKFRPAQELKDWSVTLFAELFTGIPFDKEMLKLLYSYNEGLYGLIPLKLPFTAFGRGFRAKDELVSRLRRQIEELTQSGQIEEPKYSALRRMMRSKDENGENWSIDRVATASMLMESSEDELGFPKPAEIDMELMTEWAEHVCLRCLLPVSTITDMRPVLASRLKGLGGETKLQECVDAVVDSIRGEVAAELKSAQESGCKFCLSADTWKPISKRRQHFLAMYLDFTKDFQHRRVCLAVKVAEAPRTGEKYCELFHDALKAAGLSAKDLMAGLSDHESSIRKGLRLLNVPLVGCGAHAVQLCPKHCLPPLKEGKKGVPATASDDDSDSSSSWSSSSSSSGEAAPAPAQGALQGGAPKARPGRPRNVPQDEIRKKLISPFTRYRAIVKHFAAHDDDYNFLVGDATEASIPVRAYQFETATRWNSCLNQLVSIIYNNRAHAFSRTKRNNGGPAPLDQEELKQALQFCAVFQPLKLATKLLKGEEKDGAEERQKQMTLKRGFLLWRLRVRLAHELGVDDADRARLSRKTKDEDWSEVDYEASLADEGVCDSTLQVMIVDAEPLSPSPSGAAHVDGYLELEVWGAYVELASLLANAIYLTSSASEVREKAYGEASAKPAVTQSDLKELSYLQAILDETLRVKPPSGGGFRLAEEDIEIAGYRIPKGYVVSADPRITNMDPALHANPQSFDPDRFAERPAQSLPKGTWFPGGIGLHGCPGIPLAMIISKAFLADFVQRFSSWRPTRGSKGKEGWVNIPIRILGDKYEVEVDKR
ncbi:putative cytochrome P450 120 [Symbiodinium microadriaticum]|uniref:Putative cytochrome P450 120 n=1 Tax=Symbiodinium microadriaticum TaxID=2951 RepID=A0A1Q9CGI1_SYMMI|nr:putative cytochrome P450 120 [Symbiodinium microadriaticum]CAE7228746.1 cyp120 [Symbiodinium microadriaticum]CAE7252484.1 cyp120 [Symbiodinium sp. KB8]